MSPGTRFRGIAQVVLAASIWGAAYPLTKDVLAQVPPITFGFARFTLAGLLLMGWSRTAPLQGIAPADRRQMWLMAFWGTFVLVIFMNLGLGWAPGVVSSVISGISPLFTVFLAAAWGMEPLRMRHLFAAALALTGLVLLCGDMHGMTTTGTKAVIGIVLVTIPQFAWAVYSLIGKRIMSSHPWQYACRDTFALGALMLAPVALIETVISGFGTWDLKVCLTLLFLSVLNSVVTYGLWNSALTLIPVSAASFVLYMQPISGVVLSMLMFGESTGLKGIGGICLIFIALLLALHTDETDNEQQRSSVEL
ncbi:MAG TPA: EamA family transporter [Candidatus Ozemobacteraceae bacterium]|mgnify:CR=1 FL=1|nr:EamA family transporter [Candidatus Ozemobacteraceae bacterium]